MTLIDHEPAVDRFAVPLYTQAEAATYLGVRTSTFRSWARGYHFQRQGKELIGQPVITALDKVGRRGATIPFVGLAEGYVLAAIRRSGVPLQRIRPALERLSAEMDMNHALASQRLFSDGAEVLFDYAMKASGDDLAAVRELVVVRDGQRVLSGVVESYLRRIVFGPDGYATAIPLPGFDHAEVVADVRRSFGQPIFSHGGARLGDAMAMFRGGEDIAIVAEEFGIPNLQLEDAIRRAVGPA